MVDRQKSYRGDPDAPEDVVLPNKNVLTRMQV
jgi:hypothetical protein